MYPWLKALVKSIIQVHAVVRYLAHCYCQHDKSNILFILGMQCSHSRWAVHMNAIVLKTKFCIANLLRNNLFTS
jgi:hypothetical protein